MLIAVNYHYIRPVFDAPYPSIYGVTPEQFGRQLDLLGRVGDFVGASEIREAIEGRRSLPERAIVVTLDDGLREQYEYAWPVLRQKGVPAIFFINTAAVAERRVLGVHQIHQVRAHRSPASLLALMEEHASYTGQAALAESIREKAIGHYNYDEPEVACLKYLLNFVLAPEERDRLIADCFAEIFPGEEEEISERLYMSPAEINELGGHDCIGSHSHDHLPLGLLAPDAARRELQLSIEHLSAWTGRRPVALSYPFGSHEACAAHVGESAAQLGIEFAFTVERAGNPNLDRPLHLARCDCNDLPGGKTPQWDLEQLFARIPARQWYRP